MKWKRLMDADNSVVIAGEWGGKVEDGMGDKR